MTTGPPVNAGQRDRNPLADDRFSYTVLNHPTFRYHGMSGEWVSSTCAGATSTSSSSTSHNFRNKSTDAGKRPTATRASSRTSSSRASAREYLMLSATRVNNRLLDLRNQIGAHHRGDDAYLADTDGIPSITHVTRVAQQRFNEWSKLSPTPSARPRAS